MSWISKGLGILVLGLCIASPSMAAQPMATQRVIVRQAVGPRVIIRPGFVVGPRVYAPYGWYGYGYYGTGWVYPGYAWRPNTGQVKIDTYLKEASLYVDGGYVGPISKFKKFSLTAGNHDIELRDGSGEQIFSQRVQVLVGKTIEVRQAS